MTALQYDYDMIIWYDDDDDDDDDDSGYMWWAQLADLQFLSVHCVA